MHFLKPDPEHLQIRKETHSSWSGATITSILSHPICPHTLEDTSSKMNLKNQLKWKRRIWNGRLDLKVQLF